MACSEWCWEWQTNSINWSPHLPVCLKRLSPTKGSTNHDTREQEAYSRPDRDDNDGHRLVVSSKTAKLEFPRFSGGDLT